MISISSLVSARVRAVFFDFMAVVVRPAKSIGGIRFSFSPLVSIAPSPCPLSPERPALVREATTALAFDFTSLWFTARLPVFPFSRFSPFLARLTGNFFVVISGILHQEQEWNGRTVLRPIAYGSKVLSDTEMKYGAPKAEMFAVVTFVEKYRAYLGSAPFKLRVDNRALSWLKTYSMDQSYIGRWIVRLDGYHMIIEHRMRDKHQNADSLSKKTEFCERLEQKQANQAEIKEGFSFLDKETYEEKDLENRVLSGEFRWMRRRHRHDLEERAVSSATSSTDDNSRNSGMDTYSDRNSSSGSELSELAIHTLLVETRARDMDREVYQDPDSDRYLIPSERVFDNAADDLETIPVSKRSISLLPQKEVVRTDLQPFKQETQPLAKI